MVARSLFLLAGTFAAARSQAPVGGPHGRPHVARYLRGEGREDEEAPALHYFATDPEWKYVAVRRTASEPVELFDVASESDNGARVGGVAHERGRPLSVLAALASPAEKHSEVRYTSRETGYREVR